jgi:phage FluMu protein Com
MQIRCYHCHKPFALGKDAVHAALDLLSEEKLSHYNAQCPHCRRVNRVSRDELQRAAPDWSEKKAEAETSQAEAGQAEAGTE